MNKNETLTPPPTTVFGDVYRKWRGAKLSQCT